MNKWHTELKEFIGLNGFDGDNSDGQCSGIEKVIDEPTLIEFEDEDEFIIDIKAELLISIYLNLCIEKCKRSFCYSGCT